MPFFRSVTGNRTELHLSTTLQFTVCPETPLCEGDPCHQGSYREAPNGRGFFGCADTQNNGVFWCPVPGGVDNNGIVIEGKVHICTKAQAAAAAVKDRASKTMCELEICRNDGGAQLGKDYCEALELMYSDEGELTPTILIILGRYYQTRWQYYSTLNGNLIMYFTCLQFQLQSENSVFIRTIPTHAFLADINNNFLNNHRHFWFPAKIFEFF